MVGSGVRKLRALMKGDSDLPCVVAHRDKDLYIPSRHRSARESCSQASHLSIAALPDIIRRRLFVLLSVAGDTRRSSTYLTYRVLSNNQWLSCIEMRLVSFLTGAVTSTFLFVTANAHGYFSQLYVNDKVEPFISHRCLLRCLIITLGLPM